MTASSISNWGGNFAPAAIFKFPLSFMDWYDKSISPIEQSFNTNEENISSNSFVSETFPVNITGC